MTTKVRLLELNVTINNKFKEMFNYFKIASYVKYNQPFIRITMYQYQILGYFKLINLQDHLIFELISVIV